VQSASVAEDGRRFVADPLPERRRAAHAGIADDVPRAG
jgi:hypothetical protein